MTVNKIYLNSGAKDQNTQPEEATNLFGGVVLNLRMRTGHCKLADVARQAFIQLFIFI